MHTQWNFDGYTAVVTGGSRGLGRAIADDLYRGGASLCIVDQAGALATTSLPGDWRTVAIDLAGDDALTRMQGLADELGCVDVVVANAGVVPPWRSTEALDAAEWRQVMAVNTWGVAATLGGMASALERSAHASAVLMASINGYRAHPRQMLYTASKHAVVGILRAAALDLGPRGIRVNALAPGPIATDALLGRLEHRHGEGGPAPQEALAAMAADTALGALVTPQQVASAASWLASPASAGITGVVLPVEAGLK